LFFRKPFNKFVSMKKYILTIKYNEHTDDVEYMQEEIIDYIEIPDLKDCLSDDYTIEDLLRYCKKHKCAKA
jgi:predicted RNase H-like HicB family nuclease